MKRARITVLGLCLALTAPAMAAAADGPCGGFRLSEGEVIMQRALPVAAPLSAESEVCLRAVAKAFEERPYVRSVTVAARMGGDERGNGKGLEIANAVLSVLAESSTLKGRISTVVPAIGPGQSPGIYLVYRERRSTRRVARITGINGTVEVGREPGSMRPARRGGDLFVYDRIATAKDSAALVYLADSSLLYIGQDTSLRMGELSLGNESGRQIRLELIAGEIFTMAGSGKKGSTFEIVTRTAVAGVRGTEFRTALDDQGVMRVETQEGSVELANAAATKSVQIDEGNGSLTDANGEPLPPRPLLAAATLTEPRLGVYPSFPTLKWQAVSGAVGYRVELARDAQFTSELTRRETTGVTLAPALPAGKWFWRVQAIDADGLYGKLSKIYAFQVRR